MNDHSISKFKRARIAKVYREEPNLDMAAFMERFGVGKATLRAIFRPIDRELGRLRRGQKRSGVHAKK